MNKLTLSAINMFWNMIVFDLDYSSLEYSTWNYKRYSRHYFQNKFFNKSDVIFIQLTHCRERDIKRCTFLFFRVLLIIVLCQIKLVRGSFLYQFHAIQQRNQNRVTRIGQPRESYLKCRAAVEPIRVPEDRRRGYRRQIVPRCTYESITKTRRKRRVFIEDVAGRGEDIAHHVHHAGDGDLQRDA